MIHEYKHPFRFYILATALPWTFWIIAGYISYLSPVRPLNIILVSGLAFAGLIAPNIVSFMLMLPHKDLRKDFYGRLFYLKITDIKYVFYAVFLMLSSILLAQAISLLFGYSAEQFRLVESFSFTSGIFPVWFILLAAPFFEELAWHSYGTDCLRSRLNLFTTSILFALYWGFWHLPLSFIKDYYHSNLVESGFIYSLNFFVSLFPFVLIMNWLYYKTNRNILITIIFHIAAVYFNEIFATHPMSKVIQTGLLLLLSVYLLVKEKSFFFSKSIELNK